MTTDKIWVGEIEVFGLRDGFFYLDGGAMFGIVPKTLWEKKFPADAQNRIRLGLNSLLIKTPHHILIVETGIGSDIHPKFYKFYAVERKPGLVPSFQKLGIKAEDVDYVINTHLHFDHCGGNTYRDDKGNIRPTFPQAKYVIQKGEWEHALNPNRRDKPSYIKENFEPLAKHHNLQLIEGNQTITEGVKVEVIPGHTEYHQCVKVKSEEKTLIFLGDLVPTSAHMGLPYIMSYDLFPLKTLKNKRKLFDQAIHENWVLAFNHDPGYFFGGVVKKDNKYTFQTLEN